MTDKPKKPPAKTATRKAASAKPANKKTTKTPKQAEIKNEPNLAPGGEASPPVLINAQYIKDLSFEAPSAPEIFTDMQKQQPDISINIDVRAQPLNENIFEVTLHITSECKVGDKIAFIQELVYCGVFTINVPSEHIQAVLLIECPRLLFPFARNIIADSSRDGGFPPLMLSPVDFVDMFKKRHPAATQADRSASVN
ncbi:MAG TPA: protein-export chaperone SecB [Rhodospirillales bacterium]|nr:protein-export chaperone SecB [Rhodospirillales bacterium]